MRKYGMYVFLFFIGGKKKQGGSRAGPAQPARAAGRPSARPQASSAARPAKRPANNRRGQGQKKNQGSRLVFTFMIKNLEISKPLQSINL